MSAIGIDLGGTKIEVQLFNDNWDIVARNRVATPLKYDALVKGISEQIRWAETYANNEGETKGAVVLPIGVGAAGLLNPATGLAHTANLPATGRPLKANIEADIGRPISYINDCRALAVSEAVFGAGRGKQTVVALIIGTGVGGGIAVNGHLLQGPSLTGGEFGHIAAPAQLIVDYSLPIHACGCGRRGCIETYISGPNLQRMAKTLTGIDVSPPEIAARRSGDMAQVWAAWCALTAELLHSVTLTVDPDVIILGGGLSLIEGVTDELMLACAHAQIGDFVSAKLSLAEGGATSGARGAAYVAWQEQEKKNV